MVRVEYNNYNLNYKCSDAKKSLRDFFNDRKGHINDNIVTNIVPDMYRYKPKIFISVRFARACRSLFLCLV